MPPSAMKGSLIFFVYSNFIKNGLRIIFSNKATSGEDITDNDEFFDSFNGIAQYIFIHSEEPDFKNKINEIYIYPNVNKWKQKMTSLPHRKLAHINISLIKLLHRVQWHFWTKISLLTRLTHPSSVWFLFYCWIPVGCMFVKVFFFCVSYLQRNQFINLQIELQIIFGYEIVWTHKWYRSVSNKCVSVSVSLCYFIASFCFTSVQRTIFPISFFFLNNCPPKYTYNMIYLLISWSLTRRKKNGRPEILLGSAAQNLIFGINNYFGGENPDWKLIL